MGLSRPPDEPARIRPKSVRQRYKKHFLYDYTYIERPGGGAPDAHFFSVLKSFFRNFHFCQETPISANNSFNYLEIIGVRGPI